MQLRNAGVHSLLILLPVAFCCSDASVFSVATAPNAIIADSSGMTTYEMVGVKNNYSYNVATQRRIQVKAYLVAEQQTTGCMSVCNFPSYAETSGTIRFNYEADLSDNSNDIYVGRRSTNFQRQRSKQYRFRPLNERLNGWREGSPA